jgi:hypothetical protein
MSERLEGQVGKPPGAGDPAADLADVWEMLDVLPAASAAADMAATTVDLMAVRLSPQGSSPGSRGWLVLPGWLAPTATVVGALIAGIVLGRVTIPDPVVENLPFIRHIDLLQEAGSLEFLEQLAELMTTDRPVQPRWFRLARDPKSMCSDRILQLRLPLPAPRGWRRSGLNAAIAWRSRPRPSSASLRSTAARWRLLPGAWLIHAVIASAKRLGSGT